MMRKLKSKICKTLKPGIIVPYIGKRKLAVNLDGSFVDTGKHDPLDEVSPFYIEFWTVEWLGIGHGLSGTVPVRHGHNGQPVRKGDPIGPAYNYR